MNYLLSDEKLRHLNEQWEIEYEDVEMTDSEWEVKRWNLIAQAQLDHLATMTYEEFREEVAEALRSTYFRGAEAESMGISLDFKEYFQEVTYQICALAEARVQAAVQKERGESYNEGFEAGYKKRYQEEVATLKDREEAKE